MAIATVLAPVPMNRNGIVVLVAAQKNVELMGRLVS